MKKVLLLALVISLAVPALAQTPDIISKAHRSVVFIESALPTGHTMTCSGAAIGVVRVLTADHCVPLSFYTVNVDGIPARVVKRDRELVLLEVQPRSAILILAAKEPLVGDDITAIGWFGPKSLLLSLKRSVAWYGNTADDKDYFYENGPHLNGMSGGPIIDTDGKLVGLIQGTLNGMIGGATRLNAIRDFLK